MRVRVKMPHSSTQNHSAAADFHETRYCMSIYVYRYVQLKSAQQERVKQF